MLFVKYDEYLFRVFLLAISYALLLCEARAEIGEALIEKQLHKFYTLKVMKDISKVNLVNEVLSRFFKENPHVRRIQAKEMMDVFVKEGVFNANQADGIPIRRLLRALDRGNCLHLIPFLEVERKNAYTYWYFVNKEVDEFEYVEPYVPGYKLRQQRMKEKKYRDEDYVVDLCNEILGETALKKYRFDFLRGDAREGEKGIRLPIDAYYPNSKIAIEYHEWQHVESLHYVGDRGKMTISGVKRDEQRRIYDKRKKEVLAKHGITLIEIGYNELRHDHSKCLSRTKELDKAILEKKLKVKKDDKYRDNG